MEVTVFKRGNDFYKRMLAIAIPVTLQNLITIVISMADTLMLGSLGEVALPASVLENQFSFIFLVIHSGLDEGDGVLIGLVWL